MRSRGAWVGLPPCCWREALWPRRTRWRRLLLRRHRSESSSSSWQTNLAELSVRVPVRYSMECVAATRMPICSRIERTALIRQGWPIAFGASTAPRVAGVRSGRRSDASAVVAKFSTVGSRRMNTIGSSLQSSTRVDVKSLSSRLTHTGSRAKGIRSKSRSM